MLKALLRHDGSDVSLTENGGFNIDVSQLNDLANSGTRFAQAHSWDEIPMERGLRPSIIALPIGFRSCERVIEKAENVELLFYDSILDVRSALDKKENWEVCIFVSPTSDVALDQKDWMNLASKMAALVRQGMVAVAIGGPRGDTAWELNRQRTVDAFNVIRDIAVTAANNVKIMFGAVPQMCEPCASMGDHKQSEEPYPCVSEKAFFERLHTVIEGNVPKPLFTMRAKVASRNFAYKMKKGLAEERIPLQEHGIRFKPWRQNNGPWRGREQGQSLHYGQRSQYRGGKSHQGSRNRKGVYGRNRPYF